MQIGSCLAMVIGRYVFKDLFANLIKKSKVLRALNKALRIKGAKIIMLFRLTPVMPFNIMNYGIGATSVSLRDFFLGGFGMLPELIILIYVGSAISNFK
mmetsp:Transcript_3247/g.4022  ORF Transcript_3247/g.4022 Transcript_3247/m.4022 type:complete len:99 (+) Transcript_3247:445-741(+)